MLIIHKQHVIVIYFNYLLKAYHTTWKYGILDVKILVLTN